MEMSFKQLEKTLNSYFRINPDRESTFRSRIKQLQRLEFPSGVNVGRGAKMTYTGEHLFKMVTAFELLGMGIPAQLATQIVENHWPAFAAGYALMAVQRRWGAPREKTPLFLTLRVQTMNDIQFSRDWARPVPTEVLLSDAGWFMSFFDGRRGLSKERPLRTFLSAGDLVAKVLRIASDQAGVIANEEDDEFIAWLPKGDPGFVRMTTPYPDRSNLQMRQTLHRMYSNDPSSLTPDGVEEAQQYQNDVLCRPTPF